MKNGIPAIYWVYRWAWSVLHLAILAILAILLLVWAFTDNQGAEALSGWLRWISNLRYTLSNLIPFPWD